MASSKKITNKNKTTKKPQKALKNKKKNTFSHIVVAICFIIFPLIIGFTSSLLTGDAMMSFGSLNQPPFAPPAWLFPVAWTILYLLMGVASYLIYRLNPKNRSEIRLKKAELVIYSIQLTFNFLWTILFFRFGLRYFAFGWLLAMWAMILTLVIMAFKNCKAAAWCLIPYLLWSTFAACLNIAVAVLN